MFLFIKHKLSKGYEKIAQAGTGFIGYYQNSKAIGKFWIGMYGGDPYGHLHGTISDETGAISGDQISYIFPDMETVFLGRFEDRLMMDALQSTVLNVDCDKNGMLYVDKYAEPDIYSTRFYYEPPSNVSYGGGPKDVIDPYEKKWLEVKKCDDPNMGEGVFTKRHIPKGIIISSYTGFVFNIENGERSIYLESCENNKTKTYEERQQCGKYTIPLPTRGAYIDIPPEFDKPGCFLPSMGPKVYFLFSSISNSSIF